MIPCYVMFTLLLFQLRDSFLRHVHIVVISDRGLTCQINASTTQGGQRLRAHRALVFIYITRNLQSEVILRFDHIQNGNSYEIPYKLQKTAAGRAGPFFVDAAYQPVVLKRFRCYGACDVEFDTRRPFAFVHYIPE